MVAVFLHIYFQLPAFGESSLFTFLTKDNLSQESPNYFLGKKDKKWKTGQRSTTCSPDFLSLCSTSLTQSASTTIPQSHMKVLLRSGFFRLVLLFNIHIIHSYGSFIMNSWNLVVVLCNLTNLAICKASRPQSTQVCSLWQWTLWLPAVPAHSHPFPTSEKAFSHFLGWFLMQSHPGHVEACWPQLPKAMGKNPFSGNRETTPQHVAV